MLQNKKMINLKKQIGTISDPLSNNQVSIDRSEETYQDAGGINTIQNFNKIVFSCRCIGSYSEFGGICEICESKTNFGYICKQHFTVCSRCGVGCCFRHSEEIDGKRYCRKCAFIIKTGNGVIITGSIVKSIGKGIFNLFFEEI